MKCRKAAAILVTLSILLTAAGCKYTNNQETTQSAESSTSFTEESVTESTSETESETEESTEEESTDSTESENIGTDESSEAEETTESTTAYNGFSFSTLVDLSSLVNIDKSIIKQGEKFFDDAVFVGDSVTMGLKNYVTSERNAGRSCLGNAQFICAGSLGYINSYSGTLKPTYKGSSVTIEEGINQSGAKKVFIMLGMNDFCGYAEGVAMKSARGTIESIREKCPGVKIYIESVTPILKDKQHGDFTNDGVDAFNEKMIELCNEYNLTYVDINSVMKDSDGCLNPDYCGDSNAMGIHMSYPGCKAWIDYLVNNF